MKETMEYNLQVDKCLALYQAREKEKMGDKLKPEELLNRQSLGRLLYPNSSEDSVSVSMGRLCNGKMKRFSMEWPSIIAENLGVDFNFMFGFPSVLLDEEYKRSLDDKEETKRLQASIKQQFKSDNINLTLDNLKAIDVVING